MPFPSTAAIVRRLEQALGHIPDGMRPETEVRQRAEIVLSHLSRIKAAVLVADNRGRYILVNDRAARLSGYTRDELLRLSVWDLTPMPRQVDGRYLWREFVKKGRQAGDYLLRRKDGRVLTARYVAIANVLPGIHVSLLTSDANAEVLSKAPRRGSTRA